MLWVRMRQRTGLLPVALGEAKPEPPAKRMVPVGWGMDTNLDADTGAETLEGDVQSCRVHPAGSARFPPRGSMRTYKEE